MILLIAKMYDTNKKRNFCLYGTYICLVLAFIGIKKTHCPRRSMLGLASGWLVSRVIGYLFRSVKFLNSTVFSPVPSCLAKTDITALLRL